MRGATSRAQSDGAVRRRGPTAQSGERSRANVVWRTQSGERGPRRQPHRPVRSLYCKVGIPPLRVVDTL